MPMAAQYLGLIDQIPACQLLIVLLCGKIPTDSLILPKDFHDSAVTPMMDDGKKNFENSLAWT